MSKIIKLSAVAVALSVAAASASAATIYDKDGTSLNVNGYIQTWAGNQQTSGNDNSVVDRVRFGLNGSTQLTDGITAFGYYQWQVQHAGDSTESQDVYARYAYLGADFGQYGKVLVGRYFNNLYNIEAITDVYQINAGYGEISGQRNSGKLVYAFDYKGFGADLEFQFAEDNFWLDGRKDLNVNHGLSAVLHYDSAPVLFGPIGVKAGYSYLKFQDEGTHTSVTDYDSFKAAAGSLTWGTFGKGLYLAAFYEAAKYEVRDGFADEYKDVKKKSSESVISYGFDNGVIIQGGYQWYEGQNVIDGKVQAKAGEITRKVPLLVQWNINPNFLVWAETTIDAGSSDGVDDHNLYTVGARFAF